MEGPYLRNQPSTDEYILFIFTIINSVAVWSMSLPMWSFWMCTSHSEVS